MNTQFGAAAYRQKVDFLPKDKLNASIKAVEQEAADLNAKGTPATVVLVSTEDGDSFHLVLATEEDALLYNEATTSLALLSKTLIPLTNNPEADTTLYSLYKGAHRKLADAVAGIQNAILHKALNPNPKKDDSYPFTC